MSILFKGLTRPALIKGLGVPLIPFIVMCLFVVVLAANFGDFFYFLLLIGWFVIKKLTDMDERIFDLLSLRIKVRGRPGVNKFFDAVHFSGTQYRNVDTDKLDVFMNLKNQANMSEFIPYSTHITDNIVLAKESDLIAVWSVQGTDFECKTKEDLDFLSDRLNILIRSFENENITFYTHRIRAKSHFTNEYHSGNDFADEVMKSYYHSFNEKVVYENRLFLTLCYRFTDSDDKLSAVFSGKKKVRNKALQNGLIYMNELTAKLDSYLSRFHASRLGIFTRNGNVYSSQLSFFQYLLTGKWQNVAVTNQTIDVYLGGQNLFFGSDSGQITAGDNGRYFRIIEIKDYFSKSDTGIFDALMMIPVEYNLVTSFTAVKKRISLNKIDHQIKDLTNAGDAAISQIDDLIVAKDMLVSGLISFGDASFSLLVYGDTPEDLIQKTNIVSDILQDLGLIITFSTLSLGAAFFAQLPGNYTLRPRLSLISSLNYAEMEPFHNFHSGKASGNTWGKALITQSGTGGSLYHLNYHATNDYQDFFGKNPTLAHTLILGTSNVGKTVLMITHAYAAQQFSAESSFPVNSKVKKMTTVFFDKDRAGEVAIRALGGEYFKIRTGENTGFNPFQLPPTRHNISFIKELVRLLCTVSGGTLTEYQNIQISDAVDLLMSRDNRQFGISKLIPLIQEDKDSESVKSGLKIRLSVWKQGGEYGWVFDNENDLFDISSIPVFGIDGTEFLEDKITAQVIPFYLIQKVSLLADGRRILWYLDECWQWIANNTVAGLLYNKLKTGRKLNMAIVFATQSPDELIKSPIVSALREQVATHICLANPKGKKSEYVDELQYSESVFNLIKGIDPLSREHLVIKNPQFNGDTDNFIAFSKLELGEAAKYLPVLSASTDQLQTFDSVFKEGMSPSEWLPQYLSAANKKI